MAEAVLYNEAQTLLETAAGDASVFTRLFNEYYQQLGHHVFSIFKPRPLTEEIMQDVFLIIWMGQESLTEVRCFKVTYSSDRGTRR